MNAVNTAIELRDVFRVHSTPEGDAAALQGLSLRVAEGEVLAVLGPSGSGKSTLLRLLAGLERPSAGVVRVHGEDVGKLPGRRLARYRSTLLGYADQHYARALAPELTRARARRAAARPARHRRAPSGCGAPTSCSSASACGDKRDRHPTQLSGGEQQRVALCAALAHRPKVFLADEPTGELDGATADQVYDVMAELVREHRCTTVIVSHDPESARIADRIVRIRDGRVSEEWTRDDGDSDTIVVGRGGWLRLPEELLLRAGIGSKAVARFEGGSLVVAPLAGQRSGRAPRRARPPRRTHRRAAASSPRRRGLRKRYGDDAGARGARRGVPRGRAARDRRPVGLGEDDAPPSARRARAARRGRRRRSTAPISRALDRAGRAARAALVDRLRRAAGGPRAAPLGARERRARARAARR